MIRLVSIKFRPAGRHYDFNAKDLELHAGDRVIVETDRGRALGTVAGEPREVPRAQAPEDLKNVTRPATDEDLSQAAANAPREKEAYRFCQRRIQERKMEMKLVRAEHLFDGSKIIFYFTADGRVDFRELVKDLAHHFHTRIEMRQIGVRDEAKLIGGIGICGRELCCCTFLTEFAPVSVKMAKEQGLALNPTKISGQCGRLLCCLGYEFETYCSLRKGLPKCGRKVQLQGQEAEVIDQDVLGQKVTVRLEGGQRLSVTAEQFERGEMPKTEGGALGGNASSSRQRRENQPPAQRSRRPAPSPKVETVAPPRREEPVVPAAEEGTASGEARKSTRRKSRNRRRPGRIDKEKS
jgi:cell fate regulator YaaT (PSP1 superfamily)